MQLDQALTKVAVIGAAGKMGEGISLLLFQEMARSEAEKYGAVGTGKYRLYLIDTKEETLVGLRHYLRLQLTKYAEKNINQVRKYYKENQALISNEEIIQAFVEGAMD